MGKTEVLELKDGDRAELEKIVKVRTAQAQIVARARILLLKADGETIDAVAEKVMVGKTSVQLCLKKYKEGGLKRALHDDHRSGCPASRRACPSRVAGLTASRWSVSD